MNPEAEGAHRELPTLVRDLAATISAKEARRRRAVERDDLHQDLLLCGWRAWPRARHTGDPTAYLAWRMHRAVTDHHRRRLPYGRRYWKTVEPGAPYVYPITLEHSPEPGTSDPALARVDDAQTAAAILALLDERDRELLTEHYLRGTSMTDIGARRGTSVSAVSHAMKRALRNARTVARH